MDPARLYCCALCGKSFRQRTSLLQHEKTHDEDRPFPCQNCPKRFKQATHLTQHERIHTGEKPYGCSFCGKCFRQKTILNQHTRTHTGEKPYVCCVCSKSFRQKAILDSHSRTHQSSKPYCCPIAKCHRKFRDEIEVDRHVCKHRNVDEKRNSCSSTDSGTFSPSVSSDSPDSSHNSKPNLVPISPDAVQHAVAVCSGDLSAVRTCYQGFPGQHSPFVYNGLRIPSVGHFGAATSIASVLPINFRFGTMEKPNHIVNR